MDLMIFKIIALAGLLVGSVGLLRRFVDTNKRGLPSDKSTLKGKPGKGVAYAFTLGMAPWAKESTRLHMISYLRGIGFHIGIFMSIGLLLISPVIPRLPAWIKSVTTFIILGGALLGVAGGVVRIIEHRLRTLSTPDDHFAVWLVTIWMALSATALWYSEILRIYYLFSAITLAYIPLGKIRHCLYFFFSRIFFGKFFGRRAVLPHPEPIEVR